MEPLPDPWAARPEHQFAALLHHDALAPSPAQAALIEQPKLRGELNAFSYRQALLSPASPHASYDLDDCGRGCSSDERLDHEETLRGHLHPASIVVTGRNR